MLFVFSVGMVYDDFNILIAISKIREKN